MAIKREPKPKINYAANIAEAKAKLAAAKSLLEDIKGRTTQLNDKIREMPAMNVAYVEIAKAKGERELFKIVLEFLREQTKAALNDLEAANAAAKARS